jgi:DNA-binding MarR family transcriptional regulator
LRDHQRVQFGEAVRAVLVHYPKIFFACHTRHVRDERQGRTLSAHQASILDHLDEVEPTGLTDLARHMGVTPSTMSLAVDRLERAGYVVRQRDQRDGRRVRLRLTPAGGHIKDMDKVLDPARLRAMLRTLPPDRLDRAVEGLELLGQAALASMHEKSERGKAWGRRYRTGRRRT